MEYIVTYNNSQLAPIYELREEVTLKHLIISIVGILPEELEAGYTLTIKNGKETILEKTITKLQQIRDYINNTTTIIMYYQ